MSTELSDFEHELCDWAGTPLLRFGVVGGTYYTLGHPTVDAGNDRVGDAENPREDGVSLGEDYSGGKTISFELGVDTTTDPMPHVDGADAMDYFESQWTDEDLRWHSTWFAMLRSQMTPGRTRVAFGRPRRFAEGVSRTTHKGYSTIIADFANADGRWYDDEEQSVQVGLTPAYEGGLMSPLISPLTTVSTGEQSAAATMRVRGSRRTWPVVTFKGPVTEPTVRIGPLKIGLTGSLVDGETVTFDPRPWNRSTTRVEDGANYGGRLAWDTPPMRVCLLSAGDYAVNYSGVDVTGTSTCTVSWRDAYSRW